MIFNALVTGYYINEGDLSEYTFKGKIFLILFWILLLGIGSILLLIQLSIGSFQFAWKQINEYFQISALWKLKFTKEFDNMNINNLERMNRITINCHSSDSLRDKIWGSVTDKVNKRNNYVYESDSSKD